MFFHRASSHYRDPLEHGRALGKCADDRPGSSGKADGLSNLEGMGDRPDLGSIAFGLAGDGCEGCEVARVL